MQIKDHDNLPKSDQRRALCEKRTIILRRAGHDETTAAQRRHGRPGPAVPARKRAELRALGSFFRRHGLAERSAPGHNVGKRVSTLLTAV
jgi:hypothetical protein